MFIGRRTRPALVLVTAVAAGLLGSPRVQAQEQTGARFTTLEGGQTERSMGGEGRISVTVKDQPLPQVLNGISLRSRYNIVARGDRAEQMLVTLDLQNVHWETVLKVLVAKYKLIVDRSEMARSRVIFVEAVNPVTYQSNEKMSLPEAIKMFARVGDANVILGPAVRSDIVVDFELQDIPWRTAMDILLKTYNLVLVEEDFGVLRVASPDELQQQLETRIFPLGYLQPGGSRYVAQMDSDYLEKQKSESGAQNFENASLLDVILQVKNENGKMAFEKRTNSVIVTDTPAKLDVIQRLIERLDIPPKQVHLAMRLIEMSDDDSDFLGMDWGENGLTFTANGIAFNSMFPFLGHSATNPVPEDTFGGIGVQQGSPTITGLGFPNAATSGAGGLALGRIDFGQLQTTLRLIRTYTKSRVVQAPQIIALDNEEATIQVGRLVRFAESFVNTTEGGGQASGFREAANSPVELGIQLLVIPHVTGPDNNVLLTVIPKIEDFDPTVPGGFLEFNSPTFGTLKLPQTIQRIVVTKMMLRNRETAVIGGLREETESVGYNKIPVLGDVPLLGWLFKHRRKQIEHTNLLIFVTPTVIDLEDRGALNRQFEQVRQSMSDDFQPYEHAVSSTAEGFEE